MSTTIKISRDYFTITHKVKTTTFKQWFNMVKDNHGDGIVRRFKMTDELWDKLFNYLKEDLRRVMWLAGTQTVDDIKNVELRYKKCD